jgi:outer membrane protein TolC
VWQSLSDARTRSESAARLAARAFELGEGTLTDVLVARRSVLDAALAEQTARIDALEAHARLRLDAHLLWDFDED